MKAQPELQTARVADWLSDSEFGWRARLGLVTPSPGWTVEHEWPRMLPRGVSYHVSRMPQKAITPEELRKMGEHAIEAAELLASACVDIICYGCTTETVMQGIEYDRRIIEDLKKATGIRAKTMAGAVVEGLRKLKARKLAMVTPYIEEINRCEKAFMENLGFDVVYEKALGITQAIEVAKLSPATVYQLGTEAISRAPQADVLFLSCGNLRTIEVLSALERETGKTAISSNQALLWSALRAVGINDPLHGFGSLLEIA